MSITSSFYSGLSGLDTHGIAMQVIGDNIANMHTSGFKGSSVHFEDVLGQSLSGVTGSNQTGAGTKASSIDYNFVQGSLETTDVSTDVSINGKGFFIVEDALTNEQFYTRAGHFTIDNQGYLVNNKGYRVQGYNYDAKGLTLLETLADIQISQNSMVPPKETTQVDTVLNLDVQKPPKPGISLTPVLHPTIQPPSRFTILWVKTIKYSSILRKRQIRPGSGMPSLMGQMFRVGRPGFFRSLAQGH